ncbi:hypothetical protein N7517_003659 [Penicillium concentricum]|uniref:Prion-inhibition and propagation HeLo domain-containing protein n=1 Tax=Penicillium concentricum TaxID=293559 RepID=A0A9W9S8N8_9EURO|nr:uncharacterized protein N7517_003659 [Penicillium concentricum]KAJ5371653.1 hypothetical protein N7517_003659 [Penicillium concentricum]
MDATIATVLSQCLKEFTESINSGALARYENEVSQRRWSDELGRLRIWAGNIGAHQTGQSSLDYRLRDASHLKNETMKILQRMVRVLQDLADVMNEEEEDQLGIDEGFPDTSDTEMDDQNNEMTDIQVLYQSLRNIINLLFRISMAIRRPADHDRLLGIKIKNASFFEPWAQQHVSHKFPNAEATITSRLSAAMARQKAVLKYFERHKAKLSKGLVATGDTESNYLSETVATEMAMADDMDQLQFLETNSMSGISQTSYAPSMFTANESLSIPNAPKESADNSPFECPYCCIVITIRNTKDWARHIFRDLMPYVCLSPECSTPSKLYGSRRQWYQHICEAHSVPADPQSVLNCPLCQTDIRPPLTFERHVGHHMEQLALFVLPREDPDPVEQAQLGASSEPGSLAVAGDTRNPSSDSEEGASQNEYEDASTRRVVEDFGADETHARKSTVYPVFDNAPYPPSKISLDRSDWSTRSREESSGQNYFEGIGLVPNAGSPPYPQKLLFEYSPTTSPSIGSVTVAGRSTDRESKRHHSTPHGRRSDLDIDTSGDDLPNYLSGHREGGEQSATMMGSRKVDDSDIPSLDSLQLNPSSKYTNRQKMSESDKHVEGIDAGSSSAINPEIPAKGILKPQQGNLPEDPDPIRAAGARWTKIDQRLVSPEALKAGNESFEEVSEYVVVLRVLTKEEIQEYAIKTQEIRGMLWLFHLVF